MARTSGREELLGPPTKADAAYHELRNQILKGTLKPGSRVDYAELAESFGLSITPLREALRRLEADHLVIRSAHRDVVVASLSIVEARELLTVRESLDVLAVRLAVEHMTDEEIAAAKDFLSGTDVAYAANYLAGAQLPVSLDGSIEIGRAFHRMLYVGSHNRVLIQYRDSMSSRAERYAILARQMSTFAEDSHSSEAHAGLINAIADRDADRAEAIMREHYKDPEMDFAAAIFGGEGYDRP
jgi:DNA-binding GntR family transcriptional regulator